MPGSRLPILGGKRTQATIIDSLDVGVLSFRGERQEGLNELVMERDALDEGR